MGLIMIENYGKIEEIFQLIFGQPHLSGVVTEDDRRSRASFRISKTNITILK